MKNTLYLNLSTDNYELNEPGLDSESYPQVINFKTPEVDYIDDLYVVKSYRPADQSGTNRQVTRKFYETESRFNQNHMKMLDDGRVEYIIIYRMTPFNGWQEVERKDK